MFLSYEDGTITGKRMQILTYNLMAIVQYSLARRNYFDAGDPFKMVIFEDSWHAHMLPNV